MKRTLLPAALLLLLGTSYAFAATVTLNVSGTLNDSSKTAVTGTVTIDSTAGLATALNLTVGTSSSPLYGTFTVLNGQNSSSGGYYIIGSLPTGYTGGASYPQLNIVLPVTSLVGYSGGNVCGNVGCGALGNISSGLWPNSGTFYVFTGSLTVSAAVVPTLSFWGLCGLACLLAAAAADMLRRKQRA